MPEIHTAERPAFIEQLRAEARGDIFRPAQRSNTPDPDATRYLFTVYTGNHWLELGEREPRSNMLFGEFWHQYELCILFADTNMGKSVLAMQIANSISRRSRIGPFANQVPPAKVLYIDFELSSRQFHQRYSGPAGNYNFSDNFLCARLRPDQPEIPGYFQTYNDFLIAGLEYRITQQKASVLIIDNITCLRNGTESSSVALQLMQSLKQLQTTHKLSILVLAHIPKRRNPGRPLSADDLHGSKLLINFADSAFAIGRSSTDHHLRYLKQIKQRSTAQVYGDDNVCLCRIKKTNNFLYFAFEGNSTERLLLCRATVDHELSGRVSQLAAQGLSQRQISKELNISLGLVNKLMRREG
jgi:hypothetical protein